MVFSICVQVVVLYAVLFYLLLFSELDHVAFVIGQSNLEESEFKEIFQQGRSFFAFFHPSYPGYLEMIKKRRKLSSPGGIIIADIIIAIMFIAQAIDGPSFEHKVIFGLGSILVIYSIKRSYTFKKFALSYVK